MLAATDILAAIRWWAVLALLGVTATPLTFRILRWLPDRGYAFAKMVGLLVVSYLFWLLTSLGFFGNNVGSMLLALGILATGSYLAVRRDGNDLRIWFRDNLRYVVLVEVLFLVVFALWVWIRGLNPAISGTEKPMEFAFLNAIGRSPVFPPHDPWMSGFAISYYYFGYVMTSLVARLAAVNEAVAFNLGIAWLAAGTALGAFGVVYNLIAAGRRAASARAAAGLGLLAAAAVSLAGNLQILLELLHANGVGPPSSWAWLDVRDINGPAIDAGFGTTGPRFWWWWRSSRVIHEYYLSGVPEPGLEPIVEFPAFSFILGDMHPHVLALPFAFLALAFALAWWLHPELVISDSSWSGQSIMQRLLALVKAVGPTLLLATILVLGALSFLNTWDVFIHLFIILGAFTLRQWAAHGGWHNRYIVQALLMGALLVVPATLLYLPFYLGFSSQVAPPFILPMTMRPTRLAHYLIIFAMPLVPVLLFIGTEVVRLKRRRWRIALAAAIGLLAILLLAMTASAILVGVAPEGAGRVAAVAEDLGLALTAPGLDASAPQRILWSLSAITRIAPSFLVARLSFPWLILLLLAVVGCTVMVWVGKFSTEDEHGTWAGDGIPNGTVPFTLLLILTASLLTLGPEFVYLRDNFGQRINTVFKFYYQSWVLFGVAAVYALYFLWHRARAVGWAATVTYASMLGAALMFPVFAVSSRAAEYGRAPTLDGLAHVAARDPAEYDAIQWLRREPTGIPVVLEAVGGQYSQYARVSAFSGLPTVLGWPGHEYQWRGVTDEPALREAAVEAIYGDPNWERTASLLDAYDVSLVYVGPLERSTYGPEIEEKFANRLEVAFTQDDVTIYRWLPN